MIRDQPVVVDAPMIEAIRRAKRQKGGEGALFDMATGLQRPRERDGRVNLGPKCQFPFGFTAHQPYALLEHLLFLSLMALKACVNQEPNLSNREFELSAEKLDLACLVDGPSKSPAYRAGLTVLAVGMEARKVRRYPDLRSHTTPIGRTESHLNTSPRSLCRSLSNVGFSSVICLHGSSPTGLIVGNVGRFFSF